MFDVSYSKLDSYIIKIIFLYFVLMFSKFGFKIEIPQGILRVYDRLLLFCVI